jgi:hypothetical protein
MLFGAGPPRKGRQHVTATDYPAYVAVGVLVAYMVLVGVIWRVTGTRYDALVDSRAHVLRGLSTARSAKERCLLVGELGRPGQGHLGARLAAPLSAQVWPTIPPRFGIGIIRPGWEYGTEGCRCDDPSHGQERARLPVQRGVGRFPPDQRPGSARLARPTARAPTAATATGAGYRSRPSTALAPVAGHGRVPRRMPETAVSGKSSSGSAEVTVERVGPIAGRGARRCAVSPRRPGPAHRVVARTPRTPRRSPRRSPRSSVRAGRRRSARSPPEA